MKSFEFCPALIQFDVINPDCCVVLKITFYLGGGGAVQDGVWESLLYSDAVHYAAGQ